VGTSNSHRRRVWLAGGKFGLIREITRPNWAVGAVTLAQLMIVQPCRFRRLRRLYHIYPLSWNDTVAIDTHVQGQDP
jgi:hypothetical protein